MRLLIFLLALMSAFFVSADELTVPPENSSIGRCFNRNGPSLEDVDLQACLDYIEQYYKETRSRFKSIEAEVYFETQYGTAYYINIYTTINELRGFAEYIPNSQELSCPSSHPIETKNPDGSLSCSQEPKDCPAGYHSKAVSKALGSSECVPKECPPSGSGEALYTSPNLGSSFSGGGMYCNDGCAYTVSGSNITSEKHATGTSQGAACGDKPYDNKKLADEGDNDKCSTATNGDVTILSCESATPTNDPKPPLDNDDSKTGDEPTPDKPKVDCPEGDTTCNLKNLETQMENSAQKTIDNDNKLHNKQIDAQTKNTNAILDALDGIDTTILLQTQQQDRLHAVTISKFNELVDAVNGIETGGTGGGGTGTGGGAPDCEGSASDCVPIENAEIPNETVNLQQYADKYDDWLPNAELPEESCITLTDGTNLCLSYTAIIKLFQAFSALLVISALIHSAKIVAGAF